MFLKFKNKEKTLESNAVMLSFQVQLRKEVAFRFNALSQATRAKLNKIVQVWEDPKLNNHHLLQLVAFWKNFVFSVVK